MIEEENVSFPKLQTMIHADRLAKLKNQMKRARGFEPTYPYTWTSIAFGSRANRLQGIIDCLKDKATGRNM